MSRSDAINYDEVKQSIVSKVRKEGYLMLCHCCNHILTGNIVSSTTIDNLLLFLLLTFTFEMIRKIMINMMIVIMMMMMMMMAIVMVLMAMMMMMMMMMMMIILMYLSYLSISVIHNCYTY